ncbi:hypothetical protein PILCRDRAFT_90410 [Piloderma croceum F 1598]|uniref:Uncharacterized protein n=1 Tax=Piloderma croceum (strain F 1598) TaxID=765440 RepID=A0A0C3F252_PILCF|nr:hypothetical protein PILCRDRAFT_90410 [Piloderma croceum F 1598]
MRQKSKAAHACLANLPNHFQKSFKATVEDVFDSEDDTDYIPMPDLDKVLDFGSESEDGEDNQNGEKETGPCRDQVFVLDVMDYDSNKDSDVENDEMDDDEAEIRDDAALLTFSNMLLKAQQIAVTEERRKWGETKRPRYYKGNSEQTKYCHAAKKRKITSKGQPFIQQGRTACRKSTGAICSVALKRTYQDLQEEEEESRSNSKSEFENNGMPSKNPSMPSTEKLSCIMPKQQQRVQELLDNLQKGHQPRNYSEETATDASLNAVNYQDFLALRRACAKLTVKSKDKKI